MLVRDMIRNYNETKSALITKINSIKHVPEDEIYNFINELDEVNEDLNLLNTTIYNIPTEVEDLVIIDNDGTITIPGMINNTSELEGYSVATFNLLRQILSGGYPNFLEQIEEVKSRVDQTILYQENKVKFGDAEFDEADSTIKLSTPVLTLDEENRKVVWPEVVNAESYVLSYDDEFGENISFTAVPQKANGNYSISLAEITEPGKYTIKAVAKSGNLELFTDSDEGSSEIYEVVAPAVKLEVTGFTIDQDLKRAVWNKTEGATAYTAKVLNYPIEGSDTMLKAVLAGETMVADLTAINAIGEWTVEVTAIGDGVAYESSEAATGVYEVLAPPVQVTLDSGSIALDETKDSFTFSPCPETTEVIYTEVSGVEEGKYVIAVEADSVRFTITDQVLDGETITPTIKAVANDKNYFLDSEEMAGPTVGRVKKMPKLENIVQNDVDLEFTVPQLGETGEPDVELLTFNISRPGEEDVTKTLGASELTYDYSTGNSVKIENFNSVLTSSGFNPEEIVEFLVTNSNQGDWIEDSEEIAGEFTVMQV